MPRRRPTVPPGVFWVTSAVFFLSGGSGLAYQLVWFKRFAHVWGSSSLAFAAVGASFLFGLGLGAALIGRVADRVRSPLRAYGLCELSIGLLALVIPYEIAALVGASVGLHASLPARPLLRFGTEFGVTLLVIGPPCVLMGGTLPLLIRQLTLREGSLDQATAWLYAVNTFGAALGCYLTGFHLLPWLGLLATNQLAAAINLAIGSLSLVASRGAAVRRLAGPAPSPSAAPPAAPTERLGGLLTAALLSGGAALVLEMTWSRQLALVLGGSTYAFTATLFVVLVGIALGSLIFHLWVRPVASSDAVPLVVIGVLVASTLLGKALLPALSLFVAADGVRALRGDAFWNGLLSVGVSAALEAVPAVCMGLLFPLFVHLTRSSAARVGEAVGRIYAWNTLGSILGASATAIVLFPWIGTAGALALAAALYTLSLLAIWPWRSAGARWRGAVAAVAGGVIVAALARPLDPRVTNLGLYLYGDPARDYAALAPGADWTAAIVPLFFREGASTNVFVHDVPGRARSLRLNGKVDASTGPDMLTQLGAAYLPRFLAPDARDVLVIGFGSGATPGASLLFPDTHVTACELEPAVYEAASYFAAFNHRPHERTDGRFDMVFGDGRTAIQGSWQPYDLIISEPSNPWLAGVSNLFTREHFRAVREHLREGGLLAQWVQTYNFTTRDYAMILRTVRSELPYVGVLTFAGGADTVVLASGRPILPDAAGLQRLQDTIDATPAIRDDLDRWFGTSDARQLLLLHYALGPDQLAALVEKDPGGPVNTDLNLLLEFDAPLHLFRTIPPAENATLALLAAFERPWVESLAETLGFAPGSGPEHAALGEHALDLTLRVTGNDPGSAGPLLQEAAAQFEAAIAAQSDLVFAHRGLARVRLKQDRRAEAAAAMERVVALDPGDALTHAALAEELLRLRRPGRAVTHFRAALELRPELSPADSSVMWANNLAWVLATSPDASLRNGTEAVYWATRANDAVGHEDAALLDTLAAALAEAGRFDEAIQIARRLQALAGGDPEARSAANARLAAFQASKPVRAD